MSAATVARRAGLDREALVWGALVLNTELALTLVFLARAPVGDVNPTYYAIPFVWINVALWAVWTVDAPSAPRRPRLLAGAAGLAYFAVLGTVGGLFSPHAGHAHGLLPTWSVHWVLPPGWGPLLDVSWLGANAKLFPFKVIGYAALAYLVYATLLDAATRAVGGVVGLFACVSCAWPILGSVAAAAFGSGSVVASVATSQPYRVSTVVFVSAVVLLAWRPD